MKDTRINIVKGIIRLVFHVATMVLRKVKERKQQKQEEKEIPQPEEEIEDDEEWGRSLNDRKEDEYES